MKKTAMIAIAIGMVALMAQAQDYTIYNGDGSITTIHRQPNGDYTSYNGDGSISTIIVPHDGGRCCEDGHRRRSSNIWSEDFSPGKLPDPAGLKKWEGAGVDKPCAFLNHVFSVSK